MEKHTQVTLVRIQRLLEELEKELWAGLLPLSVSVFQSIEPVAYADAVAREFAPVEPPYVWGPAWSTAWFRLEGAWPAAWGGQRVAALIDTGSEALVWDRVAPGGQAQPAQGLDQFRRDYVLHREAPADAPAADRNVELYVEAVGNHLWGGGEEFTFKQAALARLDAARWALYHDLHVLHGLAKELEESDPQRYQLVAALNDAVNEYRAQGGTGEAALRAQAVLAPAFASPAVEAAGSVCALGHSHIDVAWLWPLRETRRKCNRTFSTVLKYMEDYPQYRYVQSQAQLYAWVKEQSPELYARIKQAVAAGRWEPQGAMWVEADCNVPSGESFVRQILYGTRFFRDEFGAEQTILWLPDVFGYSAALPQIMRKAGIPYFMTQKISWNQTNKFPHHTFWWEGIDGSRVLAHFPPSDTYCGMMSAEELLRGVRNFKEHGRSDSWLYLFGYGDGGGGVTRGMLEAAERIEDLASLPKVKQEFARDWFPRMEAEVRDLRTWAGELYLEYHRGTLTTQARNKQQNRRCEVLLRDTEFLCSVAWALGRGEQPVFAYPAAEIEEAWKLTLLNQFHDILPGSSIHWVYEDSTRDYARVHEICRELKARADLAFAGLVPAGGASGFIVLNTHGWSQGGITAIPGSIEAGACSFEGHALATQAGAGFDGPEQLVELPELPESSCSFIACTSRAGAPAQPADGAVAGHGLLLENELLRAEFNEQGELLALTDKRAGREVLADGRGNELQLFDDHPNNWDAWDIDPHFDEVRLPVLTVGKASLVEAGPLRASLRIERELTPRSRVVQLIRLCAGSPRLDFETRIEWREDHALLKVAFPLAVKSPHATYEIQYGCVERPTHRNTSWDFARFEVAAQRWAVLSEPGYAVALLNDCKYGYDCQGSTLRLSLLRAPKYPDSEADMGGHRFTYSLLLLPRGLNLNVVYEAQSLNAPLLISPAPHSGASAAKDAVRRFFELEGGLVLDAVKRAEDGDGLIVRLYEPLGARGRAKLRCNLPLERAALCDLLERELEPLEHGAEGLALSYTPFEIITLKLS